MTKKKYSRNISLHFLVSVVLIFVLAICALNIVFLFSYSKKPVVLAKVAPDYQKEKEYWLTIIQKHPGYLPAYIELARIEKTLGNTTAARIYEVKAKTINPNTYLP